MPRNVLEGAESLGEPEEDSGRRIKYKPPEQKLANFELLEKFLEHYATEQDSGRLNLSLEEDFGTIVKELESIMKDSQLLGQHLIDKLTTDLRDESGSPYFRSAYLSALVQALYNLGHGSEFKINIWDWPEVGSALGPNQHTVGYVVGSHLHASEDNPLTLNVAGDLETCGFSAEYCNFIIEGTTEWCGLGAENCSFTFYDYVWKCCDAENCRFDMLPGAEYKKYEGDPAKGNVLRRMNEDGKWEEIG